MWAAVVEDLTGTEGVAPGRMLRSGGLHLHGTHFALMHPDGLVVKLSEQRVDELVAERAGHRFQVGTRTMRQWCVVPAEHRGRWPDLAREALAFVRDERQARG